MAEKSACMNCTKRKSGCHSTCEDYINWKKQHLDNVEKIRLQKEKEGRIKDYAIESAARMQRKKLGQRCF